MIHRHPVAVVLLSLCTFTLYAFFWLFETTEELKRETGDESLNPAMDVILALCTCGLWGLYASYRNTKIVARALSARGVEREDRSDVVGLLNFATLFIGWTWLVSLVVIQEELNALAAVASSGAGDSPSPAEQGPMPVVF